MPDCVGPYDLGREIETARAAIRNRLIAVNFQTKDGVCNLSHRFIRSVMDDIDQYANLRVCNACQPCDTPEDVIDTARECGITP